MLSDFVSKEYELVLKQAQFRWLNLEIVTSKALEPGQVLFGRFAENDDVVDIYETDLPRQTC